MFPSPYEIQVFDESTLFAGKIHAILCREYKNHVKGRDYYDYLFYIGKKVPFNMKYLENKLKNTGKIAMDEILSLDRVKEFLRDRFEKVNYNQAIEDVSNFIVQEESLNLWKKEFFLSTLDSLREA